MPDVTVTINGRQIALTYFSAPRVRAWIWVEARRCRIAAVSRQYPAPEIKPLTDAEQRRVLAAMGRMDLYAPREILNA